MLVSKTVYITVMRVYPKYWQLDYLPLPHYEFMIFLLQSHFSKIIKPEMKPYWYPDIYPDNLVSGRRISG